MLATLEEHQVLTAREMADILDIPIRAVARRFWRARRYGHPLVKRNRKTGRHWLTEAGAIRLAWYRLNSENDN